jgi:hypothetical protein
LPALSDTLTECGFPWEIIVVVRDSTDPTSREFTRWSELPGFRCLICSGSAQPLLAVAMGLCDARGDAVIIVDPAASQAAELVPGMIARWQAGASLVGVGIDEAIGTMQVVAWSEDALQRRATSEGLNLPAETTRFSLIDRQLADQLTQREAPAWDSQAHGGASQTESTSDVGGVDDSRSAVRRGVM